MRCFKNIMAMQKQRPPLCRYEQIAHSYIKVAFFFGHQFFLDIVLRILLSLEYSAANLIYNFVNWLNYKFCLDLTLLSHKIQIDLKLA